MLLNDYQIAALHNVRRTAASARQGHSQYAMTDAFQHILDELLIAGIESPPEQLELDFSRAQA